MRWTGGLVAAVLFAAGCSSAQPEAQPPTSPITTAAVSSAAVSSAAPTTTAGQDTTATTAAPDIEDPTRGPVTRAGIFGETTADPLDAVVIVGDSIARQIFHAAKVLVGDRVEVTYFINVGPAFAGDDWPTLLFDFVPDPASTAVIVSFGTWQATPPLAQSEVLLALESDQLQAEIRAYLAPFTRLGLPNGPALLLRPSVGEPAADALLQDANALIEPIAAALDIATSYVTDGASDAVDGQPAVDISGIAYPLRNDDFTHYCPAAALVIARDALTGQGLDVAAVAPPDVDQLLASTGGLGLFDAVGCEPITS